MEVLIGYVKTLLRDPQAEELVFDDESSIPPCFGVTPLVSVEAGAASLADGFIVMDEDVEHDASDLAPGWRLSAPIEYPLATMWRDRDGYAILVEVRYRDKRCVVTKF